ncbi:hypothetical protein [Thiolapillus sp.]|uniref:hypothetical protein n=1 Tax=Thiolapillus sp. TaxID=2017437 RepID=UPI003AF6CECF
MFSLWRKARRENSAASRLLGTTSLRFALHGWQRKCFPGSDHLSGSRLIIHVIWRPPVKALMPSFCIVEGEVDIE